MFAGARSPWRPLFSHPLSRRQATQISQNPAFAPVSTGRAEARGLTGLLGRHVSPELLGLWLIEVLVCSMLLYALLASGLTDADATVPGLRMRAANQAAALALTFGLTSVAVGLYGPQAYLRTRRVLIDTSVGVLLAFPAVWLVGHAIGIHAAGLTGVNARLAVQVLCGWTLFLFALRLAFSYALRANLFVRRVVIVGSDVHARRLAAAIGALRRGFFEVATVPSADADATLAARRTGKRKLWGVIFTSAACDTLAAGQILRAGSHGSRLYSDTEFWERELRRIDVDQIGADQADNDRFGDGALGDGGRRGGGRLDAAVHRLSDIVLSLALLAFTLPLMLLVAGLIVLDSPGPALYRQERVGLHGRVFTLLKFRSMRADAEARGPVWAARSDPRVTRVGAIIRLLRIDELPQLLNVLRGRMSFIGPRPERPHFVVQLERALPFYRERSMVKPGLTGWAQVNYPYGASVEDARAKLSYDLYYVKHRGLLLDLMILFATVRVVLFQRGAR